MGVRLHWAISYGLIAQLASLRSPQPVATEYANTGDVPFTCNPSILR